MDYNLIFDYVFPVAVAIILCGFMLDQIRLMQRVRVLEMCLNNRSNEDQMKEDEKY